MNSCCSSSNASSPLEGASGRRATRSAAQPEGESKKYEEYSLIQEADSSKDGFCEDVESAFGSATSPAPQTSKLTSLPGELLRRTCSFLGAIDLAQLACTCHLMHHTAGAPELWRRAFKSRFGNPGESERHSSLSWKHLYMHEDGIRMQAAMSEPSELRDSMQDMVRFARSAAPSPIDDDEEEDDCDCDGDDEREDESADGKGGPTTDEGTPSGVNGRDSLPPERHRSPKRKRRRTRAAQDAWRSRKGLGKPPTDSDHICSIATCTFERIGNALLCKHTGKEHQCGRTCKEREFDPTRGEFVCKITGRVFQCLEVAEPAAYDPECEAGNVWEDGELLIRGRLGASYAAGYACTSEEELAKYLKGS